RNKKTLVGIVAQPQPAAAEAEAEALDEADGDEPAVAAEPAGAAPGAAIEDAPAEVAADGDGPAIVESRFRKQGALEMARREKELEAERRGFIKFGEGEFELPPISLLRYDDTGQGGMDRVAML